MVSSTSYTFFFGMLYVLERFKSRYLNGPSSHHQVYVAVTGDADGRATFRVGL